MVEWVFPAVKRKFVSRDPLAAGFESPPPPSPPARCEDAYEPILTGQTPFDSEFISLRHMRPFSMFSENQGRMQMEKCPPCPTPQSAPGVTPIALFFQECA